MPGSTPLFYRNSNRPRAVAPLWTVHEILDLWVRDADVVDNTYLLVSLLAAGTGLHALMHLPYALQLAHG